MPSQASAGRNRGAPALNAEQALGWYVYPFEGRPLVANSGSGGGFAATLMFDKTALTGVAMLSNTQTLQDDLARHIIRPSIAADRVPIEFPLDAAALDAFVGEYRDEQGAVSLIRRTANGIELAMPAGHKAPLTPDTPTSFFVRGYGGLTVSFEANAQGEFEILHWTPQGRTTTARCIEADGQANR